MSLAAGLAFRVPTKVRNRGTEYYARRRVQITAATGEAVEATVAGTARYRVRLRRQGDALVVSCTCPYFSDRAATCKHVWATILAAAERQILASPDGPPRRIEVDAAAARGGEGAGAPERAARQPQHGPRPPQHGQRPSQHGPRPPQNGQGPAPHGPRPAQHSPRSSPPLRTFRAPLHPPEGRPDGPDWRRLVDSAREMNDERPAWTAPPDLLYVVDAVATQASGGLTLEILERKPKAGGGWGRPRSAQIRHGTIPDLPDPVDRRILAYLVGGRPATQWATWDAGFEAVPARCRLPAPVAPLVVPLLCASGRCHLRVAEQGFAAAPLAWDDGEPWSLWLEVRRDEPGGGYRLSGSLRRGEERMGLAEPALVLPSGLLFTAERAARLDTGDGFGWISLLRRRRALDVPQADGEALVERLLAHSSTPRLDLPAELSYEEVGGAPRPRLRLAGAKGRGEPVAAYLAFVYGEDEVEAGMPAHTFYRPAERRLIRRDPAAERRARERLLELGLRATPDGHGLRLPAGRVPAAARTLLAEGWLVEAQGKIYRAPGRIELRVASGIDWFELQGGVEFEGTTAALPELLAALRRGESFVALADGSFGLLPEEWLARFAPLAAAGRPEGDHLRFGSAQVSVLDAILGSEAVEGAAGTAIETSCDAAFEQARERLAAFTGIVPADAPPGFVGALREYQRAGLGWLHSLRDLGFGGCLADDMGLGKTIQVLALLEARREEGRGPSLVVAPRSLTFNWLAEAARFTPRLRVLAHAGADRGRDPADLTGHDLVVTTYGTVRRDIELLRRIDFDYLVLDEAQAIKNRDSQSAKAARLLQGRHRLALTGTPVENHLGELGSLLEFLNPGLLGASTLLRPRSGGPRQPDPETQRRLARALRPFILRRTKGQVAAELPAKVEQTLYCELRGRQRRLYDELRDHYRATLSARIDDRGLGAAKILVLEALLRLRQAACHPALLERGAADEPSAKLDVLLPQLREVLEEGHKALVFSQFTSFLALLRHHLDREKIAYAYLDGRTRDREERVARFQSDPACGLFLISLKAGGLGLNLTAADYVYLLDPWWNPAVEAQAIDRAHRLGQTRQVFAYRLVARDTVEEKILALQETKRELADAIIQADQSLLRRLTPDDLDLLLS